MIEEKVNRLRIVVHEMGYEIDMLSSSLTMDEVEERVDRLMKKGFRFQMEQTTELEDDPMIQ